MADNMDILHFEEAIQLMQVGAYGFKFKVNSGGTFGVELDDTQRTKLVFIPEPEEKV